MRVIVCGAGRVGSNIAQALAAENNDVVVIDRDPALVASVTDRLDVRGVCGHGAQPDILQAAGADDADMLIAVTYHDEVNMVACQVAHSIFRIPKKIARIRSKSYLSTSQGGFFDIKNMPVNVRISPELEVAQSVMRRLKAPGAFDSADFFDGAARMLGVTVAEDCPIINTPLKQLTQLFPDLQAVVVAYVREGRLLTPSGEDQLFPGDQAYFVAPIAKVERTLGLFGHTEAQTRRAILLGGGNIGLEVAERLERAPGQAARAKLIELDRARAEHCAERLDRTIVLNGDGLSPPILAEAGVAEADTFIALSSDDKANLLSSVLAKDMGCRRAVALVNDPDLARLAAPMGLDEMIDPRAATVSSILLHLRKGKVRRLYAVRDGAGELIEAQVLETSPLAGTPLRSIEWPSGVMFGLLKTRAGDVLPLNNAAVAQPGDHVLIFALKSAVKQVERMVRVDVEFFG